MGRPKVDWLQIRSEYVTALQPVTFTDLATKYGLARGTVNLRAIKEGWSLERDRHIARTAEQTNEKMEGIVSTEGAKFDSEMFNRIKALLTRLDTETKTTIDSGVARVYSDMFKALTSAQVVGKAALGDKADGGSLDLLVLEIKKALT